MNCKECDRLVDAVNDFLKFFGTNSEWKRENRNAKPVTRKDLKPIREALIAHLSAHHGRCALEQR